MFHVSNLSRLSCQTYHVPDLEIMTSGENQEVNLFQTGSRFRRCALNRECPVQATCYDIIDMEQSQKRRFSCAMEYYGVLYMGCYVLWGTMYYGVLCTMGYYAVRYFGVRWRTMGSMGFHGVS